jgi:large subunit ribosomal protein L25
MPEIPLVVESGRGHGTAESRRLRAAGKIPAIVYGHGIDPIAIAVDGRELRTALGHEAGSNALLRLEIGDTHHLALAREIQRHPVRHTVTHIDFLVVSRDEIVSADITLALVGEAVEVARADGTVDQELFALPVKAKPGDLPSHIEIDIAGLSVGDVIRVSELDLPEGVTTELDPETVLVVAHLPKGPTAEELEAEAEAAAESEAEGGAAGAGDASAEAGDGSES